ncbi:hypothetical protein ACQR09_22975 [Bradyrhizobium oligotrophicum]|uniref:hypothetical protein n=1 Tax=Bradyrhizobium oligotrophicum TaxID=44255 RepID=UPI003EBB00DD
MVRPTTTAHSVAPTEPQSNDLDAFSIAEFCRRHCFSSPQFYKLKLQGLAPETFRVGTRVLISREAAARWRAEREAASAVKAVAK